MPERVLTINGPETLPDAALTLLDDKELDAVVARAFFPETKLTRLNEITAGYDDRSGSAPCIEEYGEKAAEALNEVALRTGKWLVAHNFGGLDPYGHFLGDKIKYGVGDLHIDTPAFKNRISGPLVASIGLRSTGLFSVQRGISVINKNGNYDVKLHEAVWNKYNNYEGVSRQYWFKHRCEFSNIVQRPTDLILIVNTPDPSLHGTQFALPKRKAAIHELAYKTDRNTRWTRTEPSLRNLLPRIMQGV